jgi:hypothetical protein
MPHNKPLQETRPPAVLLGTPRASRDGARLTAALEVTSIGRCGMKYQIAKKPGSLEIEVSGVEGKEKQLLEAFRECKEGRCACPTQEYAKLDALELNQSSGTINLTLKAKKGVEFDQAEIQRCLDHTKERVKSRT